MLLFSDLLNKNLHLKNEGLLIYRLSIFLNLEKILSFGQSLGIRLSLAEFSSGAISNYSI